jgi:RNA polymerase sigma-54 factor
MLLQSQSPALRHLTTAHLAQTMSLLELNAVELGQKIEAELANNPALELVDSRHCPTCHRPLRDNRFCPNCISLHESSSEQPVIFYSYRKDFYNRPASTDLDSDLPDDNFAAREETLAEYVLHQIAPELPKDDRAIAMHILTSLDEDGLLSVPISEICYYHHVPVARVEKVIHLIQRADPLGVGSPTSQEALLVQLEALAEFKSPPTLTAEAIQAGIELLSPHHCTDLARVLKTSAVHAREIVQFIGDNLNPFPARAHWGEHELAHKASEEGVYHHPDIIISRMNDEQDTPLMIEIGMPYAGTLRVNPLFREALKQAPVDKAELWQADMEHANLFVKCLQQRNNTISRLIQRLAVYQRNFVLYGDAHLKPYTRAELADELEVHESTISRAVSSKTVQLPSRRIIPLSIFFDRSLNIRSTLKTIIDNEMKPLSDTQLVRMLSREGYDVARRTVAKYRSMEGILPAHLRGHVR